MSENQPSTQEPLIPFELDPAPRKRGRPPGSKNKSTAAPLALGDEAVLRAWVGLWALLRLVVWIVGRFFVSADERVELLDLTSKEAAADAQSLSPFLASHPSALRVLGYVGAPVAILSRVKDKIQVTKVEPKDAPPAKAPGEGA